ncbi:hypothetical protein GALMADRAFT_711168 [Galerina marginata CBS 339.88]|uniref:Uncharacterized protein n=1 Tax=Galerina marginata (strain CBS 339.88) TaxID=685588 RepID=A0A067TZ87_GALM3|nr:hypothetical protein GALMADRAFT_711168 [Galerina marginata CBS 339.88]
MLVWIGFYGEAHETAAPWFYRTNYNQLVFKALGHLGNMCITAFVALLILVPLGIARHQRIDFQETDDGEIHVEPINLKTITTWIISWLTTFTIFEAGLLWGTRPAERRRTATIITRLMSRLLLLLYLWAMMWMVLLLWLQTSREALGCLITVLGRFGITKLLVGEVILHGYDEDSPLKYQASNGLFAFCLTCAPVTIVVWKTTTTTFINSQAMSTAV